MMKNILCLHRIAPQLLTLEQHKEGSRRLGHGTELGKASRRKVGNAGRTWFQRSNLFAGPPGRHKARPSVTKPRPPPPKFSELPILPSFSLTRPPRQASVPVR